MVNTSPTFRYDAMLRGSVPLFFTVAVCWDVLPIVTLLNKIFGVRNATSTEIPVPVKVIIFVIVQPR